MRTKDSLGRKKRLVLILAGVTALAGWIVLSGLGNQWRSAGQARLVSIMPLPSVAGMFEGEYCEWVPVSASEPLAASLWQEAGAPQASGGSGTATRAPLRVIRDSYPSYSSVAVDLRNNEVIMTDENLFQVLTYDRLANTPPTASMTEPKRIIGGEQTKIEFQWPRLAGVRTFDERWELKKRIRRVVGEGATAYVYNRGDRHWVMGDTSAIANDQHDYLHQISVRPSVGLFSLVSQISPNGGDNFEDLTILDSTDPNQWLLVIEVPRDDGLVVYRGLFRELDR